MWKIGNFAEIKLQGFKLEFLDSLVQSMLASLPLGKYSNDVIRDKLEQQFKLKFESREVIDSLERLSAKGYIYTAPDLGDVNLREYAMNPTQKSFLMEKLNEKVGFGNQVISEWLSGLKSKYPELDVEQLAQIKNDLDAFLLWTFSRQSTENLFAAKGVGENGNNLLEQPDITSFSDILPTRDSVVHQVRILELPKFFTEATSERRNYIAEKLNQHFIMQVLLLESDNDSFVDILDSAGESAKKTAHQDMIEEIYQHNSEKALEGESAETIKAKLNPAGLDVIKKIMLANDIWSVLDIVVNKFPTLIGYDECCIYMESDLFAGFGGVNNFDGWEFENRGAFQPTGNELVLAATNRGVQILSVGKVFAVTDEVITGRVYKTGLPVGFSENLITELFPFTNKDGLENMFPGHNKNDILRGAKAALILPLPFNDKTIGTLEFYSNDNLLENPFYSLIPAHNLNMIISERLSAMMEVLRTKKQTNNLLMSLTHEIDTPLTGILAEAENLIKEIPKESKFFEPVQRIGELVSRLQMQTATIMAVISGKVPQRHFKSHGIYRPLKEASELFKPEAKQKGCDIVEPKARDGKFPNIEMSLFDLTIAFKNLIHNAVKYSYKPPANLDVHRTIKIWGQQDNKFQEYYVVYIQNYGVGITQEEIEKGLIFREYYRGEKASDRKRTGAGFGLAYAKLVIERLHRGSINVTSVPVEGGAYLSTFAISLPIKHPT